MDIMLIKIHVVANSSVSNIQELGNELKIRVKAKPIGGKANKEIIGILAMHFGVHKRNVKIINGQHSNKKIVEIDK